MFVQLNSQIDYSKMGRWTFLYLSAFLIKCKMLKKRKAAHLSQQAKLFSVKAQFTVGSSGSCWTETEIIPQC